MYKRQAAQLGKIGERLHQILAETDGMRGDEADAPDAFHFMHGFQQLDEAALAVCRFHLPAVPVSYTHLDVYKRQRQVLDCLKESPILRR